MREKADEWVDNARQAVLKIPDEINFYLSEFESRLKYGN